VARLKELHDAMPKNKRSSPPQGQDPDGGRSPNG
jgi:hypothetical protein